MGKLTVKGNLENLTAEQLKYDRVFKTVFRYKGIVALVLKYCIQELKDYTHEEIMRFIVDEKDETYTTKEELFESEMSLRDTENGHNNEAFIKFDLKFNLQIPGRDEKSQVIITVDLEMQKGHTNYSLIARSIYYAASILRDTMTKRDDYNSINKVYSIWICDKRIIKSNDKSNTLDIDNAWFHRYTMLRTYYSGELPEDIEEYGKHSGFYKYDPEADLISIVIIELNKMNDKQNKELNEIMDAIFNSDKTKTFNVIEKYTKVNLTKTKKIKGGIENMLTQQEREQICIEEGRAEGRAEGEAAALKASIKTAFESAIAMYNGDKAKAVKLVTQLLKVTKEQIDDAIKE